ncbi:MAG: hypothetical protein ACE37H_04890 [Phycisphaeraceae bacterium]
MAAHTPKTLEADLVELCAWLIKELEGMGSDKASLISVLAGIEKREGSYFLNLDAVRDYRKKHSRTRGVKDPTESQISQVNRLLIAPACFAHGETTWRWMVPVKMPKAKAGEWPIRTREYGESWQNTYRRYKRKLATDDPQEFLRYWLKQEKAMSELGLGVLDSRQAKASLRNESHALELAYTSILSDLAGYVADQTPVFLLVYGELNQKLLQSAARDWRGQIAHRSSGFHGAWFEGEEKCVSPAVRAVMAAHKLLSQPSQKGRKQAKKEPVSRMIVLKGPSRLSEAKTYIRSLHEKINHKSFKSSSGEVYLDPYMWVTIGDWVNTQRHPPMPIKALENIDERWARLDGFGTCREPFAESTIKKENLVCRQNELSQLNKSWLDVATPKSAAKRLRRTDIIQVEGPDGSGKRSLLDVFFQKRVLEKTTTSVPLRFTHAGPHYPFSPFIDTITRVFDVDPCASYSKRLAALKEALGDRGGAVSHKDLEAILTEQDNADANAPIYRDAASPSSTHKRYMQLRKSLRNVVRDAIIGAAIKKPLFIAAFDLHRATKESRYLFFDICNDVHNDKELRELPILIAYTVRDESGEQDKQFDFTPKRIVLRHLSLNEYNELVQQYRKDGFDFDQEEIDAFWNAGPVFPGRFVSQMIRPVKIDTRTQQSSATLARILRPHATQPNTDFATLHARAVGAMALMSLLGDETYPRVLASFILSHPRVSKVISNRNTSKHQENLEKSVKELLEHAATSGVLAASSIREASHGKQYRFLNPIHAIALRCHVRRRLSKIKNGTEASQELAQMLVDANGAPSIRQWESAASLMQFGADQYDQCSRYWQSAAEATLRLGDPNGAQRRFKRAYDAARRHIHSGFDDPEDWALVMEAYRRYLYAIRLQDVTPDPGAERRFKQYARKANAFAKGAESEFDARLCQWHLADISGNHHQGSKRVQFIRRAIEHAEFKGDMPVSTQQHRELAYAAWATAMASGELHAASRYYAQLMTLRVLSENNLATQMTLSSGHDLEFYAPARHAAVHWLTGDFSGVHELKSMLLKRLGELDSDDVFRQFWAAAYFIPVALFMDWHEVADQFMPYVHEPECTRLGGTMSGIAKLLKQVSRLPAIDDTKTLRELLQSLGHVTPHQSSLKKDTGSPSKSSVLKSLGKKHQSVWVCLIARRWLEITDQTNDSALACVLDRTISDCINRRERLLLAYLYRLRAGLFERLSQLDQCQQLLDQSIDLARTQGAVTLEIESQQYKLSVISDAEEQQASIQRLSQLSKQCDFPINHPVADSIKRSLKI